MPDFEIKLWNENNSPINNSFVKEMYKKKKWAFVSDYIRFWVLYNEGGIYLDTDMEIIRPLNVFLDNNVFMGKTRDGFVACGIVGSIPRHPFIKKILDYYDNCSDYSTRGTSPRVVTKMLKENIFSDVSLFDYKYFYPCYDGEVCDQDILKAAFTDHHWEESWVSCSDLRKLLRRFGVMKYIKKIVHRF